jgi:hypothetical protein
MALMELKATRVIRGILDLRGTPEQMVQRAMRDPKAKRETLVPKESKAPKVLKDLRGLLVQMRHGL